MSHRLEDIASRLGIDVAEAKTVMKLSGFLKSLPKEHYEEFYETLPKTWRDLYLAITISDVDAAPSAITIEYTNKAISAFETNNQQLINHAYIRSIKELRTLTGASLKMAKGAIDSIDRSKNVISQPCSVNEAYWYATDVNKLQYISVVNAIY